MSQGAGEVRNGHPYFPEDVVVPNYVPNVTPVGSLLGNFVCLIGIFLIPVVYMARRINPCLSIEELVVMSWFLLCKSHHL